MLLAPAGAVLVLDGVFLHRDELAGWWARSVWLEVPFAASVARTAVRDGTSPDPDDPSMTRYVQGQRLYLSVCAPAEHADLVVDDADLDAPTLRG